MIISASRRTDIPAFYGEWLYNRLLEGEVLVRNPMNPKVLTRIPLNPKDIECLVFWTKNPKNFMPYLEKIDALGYRYYFQFTLTAYDQQIERKVGKKAGIIGSFIELSERIGKERVIWRYDPIIVNEKYPIAYHEKYFGLLCEKLHDHTEKCVISFIDQYNFLKKDFAAFQVKELDADTMREIAKSICGIAGKYRLRVATCSEKIDLKDLGIEHNKCIDDELIGRIRGEPLQYVKDPSQREECGCTVSRDIGVYNTCQHGCIYCYAKRGGMRQKVGYDPKSLMLCDAVRGDEKITTLDIKKDKSSRLELFS